MRVLATTIGAAALLLTAPAIAAEGLYVEGTLGYVIPNEVEVGGIDADTEGGLMVGGAIGTLLDQGVTIEGEVTYSARDFDGTSAELSALGVMANAALDFDIQNNIGGYVGGGIGVVNIDVEGFGVSDNEWVFGYQFMAGLTMSGSENAEFFAEYRYQGANEASIQSVPVNYTSHIIGVGARFGF